MTNAALFKTVAERDSLQLGSDARKVVEFLNLRNDDVSKIVGVSPRSVRYDEMIPRPMLERLEEIASICNQVATFFDGNREKTALWFRTPNPMLGGVSPRDMLRFGRYDKLRRFVVSAIIDAEKDAAAAERLAISQEHAAQG